MSRSFSRAPALALCLGALLALSACERAVPPPPPAPEAPAAPAPKEVRAVLVTMFEIGEDRDDQAGEFQLWLERRDLSERIEFPAHHDLYYDPASKLLVISGGDGYEDFSNGAISDMVGRDDSTNHLLLWQV